MPIQQLMLLVIIQLSKTSIFAMQLHLMLYAGAATAAANNKIISNVNVLANNVVYYNTSIVVPANSKIYVDQVTANAVTFTISGVEYA
jgi:hypothetical protein